MSRRLGLMIGLLCVLSGLTSLIYETLWIRVLSFGVGSTSASMSIVLSIFFLGLSAGSFLCGRYIHKIKRPVLFYGILEGGLGLYSGLAIYPLFYLHKIVAMLPLVGSLAWLGITVKFVLVFLLLIFPTVCMGATLPLLIKIFVRRDEVVGRYVSRLYALNTFGAVFGALITGFWLIPNVGIISANWIAVAINVLVFFGAILASRALGPAGETAPVSAEPRTRVDLSKISNREKGILWAAGACGFVSISSQVVWSKYLSIYFGTNIYGLGLVLAMYLLGIALGSFALSFVIRRVKNPARLFYTLFIVSAAMVLLTSYALNEAPKMATYVHFYLGGWMSFLTVKSLVGALILFLPTCIFGALFPLAITLLTDSHEKAPAVVGIAYSVNTVGAILGSYLAGIVLIPNLGSSVTIDVAAAVAVLTAAFLTYQSTHEAKQKNLSYGMVGAVVLALFLFNQLDFQNLIKSAYHNASASYKKGSKKSALKAALEPYSKSFEEFQLIVEGETGIISLSHDPHDGDNYRDYLRLKTNGLNESVYNMNNLDELPKYEALIGLLPYLFSRNPNEAFIVGYGGGFTVDFLTSTDLKRVNVVELEEGILKAADYVYKKDNPILKRKNLNLKIEDARFVLASKQLGPQDIIVSQPSHSWLSGAANLFTKEFFLIVKDNLSERGIYSQWLNLYNMDVPVLQSLLKTFFSVFPYGAVFTELGDQELVLLGSNSPLDLNLKKLELISANPTFQKKLTQVFNQSSYDLLSMFSLSREHALQLTQDAVINTDVNVFAEVNQSALFYEGLKNRQTPQSYLSSVFRGDYSHILNAKQQKEPNFYYNLLVSLNGNSQYDKFGVVLNRFEEAAKDDPAQWWNLGYFCLKAQRYQSALTYLTKALKHQKKVGVLNLALSTLTELGKPGDALKLAAQNPSLRDKITDCYLGQAHLDLGQLNGAHPLFSKMVRDIPGYTEACGDYFNKIVGNYYFARKDYTTALPFLVAYYEAFPADVHTVQTMVASYHATNDTGNEEAFRLYLKQVQTSEVKQLQNMATYYQQAGFSGDAEVLSSKAKQIEKVSTAE